VNFLRLRAVVVALVAAPVAALPGVAHAADDTMVGQVVQAWVEHKVPTEAAAQAEHSLLTWIETDDGDAVRVPTDDLSDELGSVPVGATVEVTVGDGVRDEAAATQRLDPAREVLDAEVLAPATPGQTMPTTPGTVTDTVTVVMMRPRGVASDGRSLADVVAAVDGPVSAFWDEQTDGRARIGAAATNYDWFQGTTDCSDPYALWDEAATHAHWTRAPGRHLLVYLPRNSPGCAYGLGEVGIGLSGGGRLYVTDDLPSVIAHELGHNFGLGHSSERQCDSSVDTGSCSTTAYRDYYDVMGASWDQLGSLNLPQAARLGVLPPGSTLTLTPTDPGAVTTIAPISGRAGVRGIRLSVPGGASYWLEYRPASARDGWLSTAANWPALQAGVLLRKESSGSDTSLLLDGTPSSRSRWSGDLRAALPVGTTVRLGSDDFSVTVTGVSPSGAQVSVDTPADGRFMRTADSPAVYLTSGSSRYTVPNIATLTALAPLGPVRYVTQQYLDRWPVAGTLSRVVTSPDGTAWFLDAGMKLPITSCALLADYGASCAAPLPLSQRAIDAFVTGPPLTPLYRTTSGKTFYVTGGVKREVVDDQALVSAGLPTSGVRLLETGISYLPYGPPITRDGVVIRGRQSGTVVVAAGGTLTAVPAGVRAATALASRPLRSVDDAGLNQLPATSAPGPWVQEAHGSRVFLLTAQGKLLVGDPGLAPASVPAVDAAFLALFPDAGNLGPGTFVKGSGSSGVYALVAGIRRPVLSWTDLVALAGDDPTPDILTLDQRLADLLPVGPARLGPGSLVHSPRSAAVYLVDGTSELIPLGSFSITRELGATRIRRVADADIDAYTVRATGLGTAVDCAGTRYQGLGGRLYTVGADVASAYPSSYTALDPLTCATLPRAGTGVTVFLRASSGAIYHIEAGARRVIHSYGAYLAMGGTSTNTMQASDFALSLLPAGPPL
jgi:hypothetical protein